MNLEQLRGGARAARRALGDCLFPRPPAGRRAGAGRARAILALAFLALAFVQLLRPGLSASFDSLWAEDGTIFLQGAVSHGFGQAIFLPYANYLNVVEHAIGELAGLAPLGYAPVVISVLAACVVATAGLVVWHAAEGHIPDPYLRGGLAICAVLAPLAGLESVVSAAYSSWFLLFAAFWVLLWRPRTAAGAAAASVFILLTALSTPGVWFLLPLAALRAFAIEDGRDAAIVASYAAGALVQVPVVLSSTETIGHSEWTRAIPAAYGQRVVDGALLGLRLGGRAWVELGWPGALALGALALAAFLLALRRSTRQALFFSAVAVPTSVLMFFGSAYQRGAGPALLWPHGGDPGGPTRYLIVPALILVAVGLVVVQGVRLRNPGTLSRGLAAGAVALVAIAVVTSFDVAERSYRGTPPWRDSLRAAAAECRRSGDESEAVPVSPRGVFGVRISCPELIAYAE